MDNRAEPTKMETVLILCVTFLVQITEAVGTVGWLNRAAGAVDNMDNPNYLAIADFIQKWKPDHSFVFQHFWGYPYVIIAVSGIFRLTHVQALIAISLTSAIVACVLLHELYGGLVAVALGMVSATWILLSVFGGCEPLFMVLLFGAFAAARRERILLAIVLGCAATAVRPIGILMPLALVSVLLWRRDWAVAARCCALGVVLAVAYAVPVRHLTGDAFLQPKLYSVDWQAHEFPFRYGGLITIPSLRLFQGFYYLHDSWRSLPSALLHLAWILVTLGGAIALWKHCRMPDLPPVERVFGCAYITFFLCYNFDYVTMYIARFIVPVLPLVLFEVRHWIPRDRRVLWPLVALSIVFNTVVLFGFRTVFGFTLPGIKLTPKPWE